MKKLRIILQHNFIYYFLLFICFISYFICSNINYSSVYHSFDDEEFIINNILIKDYGVKLELKGAEKVLGYLYCEQEDIDDFLKKYSLGDKVIINGEIINVSNNTVPNTFNYKKYLISNDIYSSVDISSIEKVSDNDSIFYGIKTFMLEHGKKLDKSYPYINSLIFGNNNYLDEDVLTTYRDNGISHLFAISGLHISIFIVVFSWFLDKIKVKSLFKSIILILFLIFYMFVTNFSMSVLRGAIFAILIMFNKIFKLEINKKNLLILTLVIILTFNPLYLNNIGLQYSFLVTLFLIMYSSLIKGNEIKKLFLISFIAFFVSYPITVNNFYQVNFLSIIYNIFFVPYVSNLLLPLVMIGYLLPFLDEVIYFFVIIIEWVSHLLNEIDFVKISFCKMSVSMIVSYYVIICLLFRDMKYGKYRYLFVLALFLILHYFMPFKSNDHILFFDVGQGDASFISVNKTYTLIDTGGLVMFNNKQYTYKLTKNRLLPYFKSKGIRKIDNLILTHGDNDHMKEAYYLIENFNVLNVYMNSNEMNQEEKLIYNLCIEKDINVYLVKKNDLIDIGGYTLQSLNSDRSDENDSSIVLYGKIKDYKVLFTGDISKNIERLIIDEYNIKDVHILKMAHHGSSTSNDYYFLSEVNPKYSIISSGLDNRFGHPSYSTIDSINKLNLKYFNTAYNGSIFFSLNKGTYLTYPP